MAQPWNSCGGPWLNNIPISNNTQTFDYNHQTAVRAPVPISTNSTNQSPVVVTTNSTATNNVYNTGYAWSSTAYPYGYPPPTFYSQPPFNPLAYNPNQQTVTTSTTQPAAVNQWNVPQQYTMYHPSVVPPTYNAVPPTTFQSTRPINNAAINRTTLQRPTAPQISTQAFTNALPNVPLSQPPVSLAAQEKWSPELKDFVKRAFLSIDTPQEKDQMERILKQKLEYVFKNNKTVDWTQESIPILPSAILAAAAAKNGPRQPPPSVSSINLVRPVSLARAPNAVDCTGPGRRSLRLPTGMLSNGVRGRIPFNNNPVCNQLPLQATINSAVPSSAITNSTSRRSPLKRRSESSRSSSPASSSPHIRARKPSAKRRIRNRASSTSSSSSSRSPPRRSYRDVSSDSSSSSHRSSHGTESIRGGRGGKNKRKGRGGAIQQSTTTTKGSGGLLSRKARNRRGRGGLAQFTVSANDSRLALKRAERFKDHLAESTIAQSTGQILARKDGDDELVSDLSQCQIVGTMQDLEKSYLRLTRAPEPHEIRPIGVLKSSLEHVTRNWNEKKKDYHWVCEQFKSIRQDLTVQCIENAFTVSVYEAHAVAALEASDFEEFNQCQSQLQRLHQHGLGITRLLEFTAYRLLYYLFTDDLLGINTIVSGLKPSHKSNECIKFASSIRSALALHNYSRFFKLACPDNNSNSQPDGAAPQQPPLLCGFVLRWFLERERQKAIKTIFKVLEYLTKTLGFAANSDCLEFLCGHFNLDSSSQLLANTEKLDCKAIWNHFCSATPTDDNA